MKAAQDQYLELVAKLRADNRGAFLQWCHSVHLADATPKPPAAATKPPTPPVAPAAPAPTNDGATTSAAAAVPAPKPAKEERSNVHLGVTCDVSGMTPITGNRWKKIDQNYDLCEAEYNKLSPEVCT